MLGIYEREQANAALKKLGLWEAEESQAAKKKLERQREKVKQKCAVAQTPRGQVRPRRTQGRTPRAQVKTRVAVSISGGAEKSR